MLSACPELLQRVSQRTGLSKLRRGGLELPHWQRGGGGCILVRRLRCRRFSFSHHGGGARAAVGAWAAVRCRLRRVRSTKSVALVRSWWGGAGCETYSGLASMSPCSNKLLELPRWAADSSSAKELSSSVSSRAGVFAAACGAKMGFCGDERVLTGRKGAPGLRAVLLMDCGGRGGEAEQCTQLCSGARQPTRWPVVARKPFTCYPIRHQPWSGRPALPWQCSTTRRAATLGHAITRPAISVFPPSALLYAHRACTPDKAMRIRRPFGGTRNTALLRCTETV
jgi:hypothetical protein